ncbi:MAG: ABC transporter permease/substrate-binding protein [Sandaracinaceae bacterium]
MTNVAQLAELTLAHLRLSVWALCLGAAISIPLGVFASTRPRLERATLAIASVVQTIPGLALLAVMVPALAALSRVGLPIPSIGMLPAVLGLTLYSVLPMLRNTVVGLSEVSPAIKEAARGIGMTPRQQLVQVELPLAAPIIVAGVRTATVWTVGMATLATPVGGSGLGDLIFLGLQIRDHGAVLLGCLGSAALALSLDGLIRLAERGIRERRRGLSLGVAAIGGLLVLYTVGTPIAAALSSDGASEVRIGCKSFTEQHILGELLALEVRETGEEARVMRSLGSTVAFDALAAGEIDLYVDYTGTLYTQAMGRDRLPADRAAVLDEVRGWLAREHGIEVVARLGFENAYALAARRPADGGPRVTRLSELAPLAPSLSVGGDYELFGRGEWASVRETYGLTFREQRAMDPTLLYRAVADGQVDVIGAYTTDGRIDAFDLVVLEDDRGAIPPYDALLLASASFGATHPTVLEHLRRLDGAIDAERMRALNRAVDRDGRDVADVAREAQGGLDR